MALTATQRIEPGRLDDVTVGLCGVSTGSLVRTLYRDVFFAPLNKFHQGFYDKVDAVNDDGTPTHQYVVWAGPRGVGKTRSALLGLGSRSILYALREFIIYATASEPAAISQTENLKRRLLSKAIKATYGSIRTRQIEEMDEEFSKTGWVASLPYSDRPDYIGTRVIPRGAMQQFRSAVFDKARPDLILGDDLDDPRIMTNEKMRDAIDKWWYGDVLPMVSQYHNRWQVVYMGTLTHRDCVLGRLLRRSSWEHVRQPICDENFRTVDENYCSQTKLDGLIAKYEEAGMINVFRREFMVEDIEDTMPALDQSMFQRYDETEEQLSRNPRIINLVVIDPANAPPNASSKNAEVGIDGIGVRRDPSDPRKPNRIYVREVVGRRMWPEEMHRISIDMAVRIGARAIACEVQGGGVHIEQPFKDAIRMSGKNIMFIPVKATKMVGVADYDYSEVKNRAKVRRSAEGLLPYYRQGLVWHSPTNQGVRELESALLSWPEVKRWDIVDPLAHLLNVMHQNDFTMLSQAGYTQDPNRFSKAIEELRRRQGIRYMPKQGTDYSLAALMRAR